MNNKLLDLSVKLHSISVFRNIFSDEIFSSLVNLLDAVTSSEKISDKKKIDLYAEFVFLLYNTNGGNLTEYIKRLVNDDENSYVRHSCNREEPSENLKKSLSNDLETLQELASLKSSDIIGEIGFGISLPEWESSSCDLTVSYIDRIKNINKYGYGIYARYHMFYIDENNHIVPVSHPDSTRLTDLIDYEYEKHVILENTLALLKGKPAANILLTGDAGTGKSSTVKAVVNELYNEGLRIIEVRKEQLREIPAILNELNKNPLKFILFIDDLSFANDDDNFSAMKAILEGSVSSKSQNIVIYATSNRRHLVKEKFSDREGDDIHRNDTTQEIISLSERFGIQLTFSRPDKATYLDIVHHLADSNNIKYNTEKLDLAAERFALIRGTRSARAAKQFIDGLISGSDEDIE